MGIKPIAILVGVIAIMAFFFYLESHPDKNPLKNDSSLPPIHQGNDMDREVTLKGTYICLPHKDTNGPQTLECAFGFKGEDGFNYALSMEQSDTPDFQDGKSVSVEGFFVPVEALSNDHWQKYDIKGILQIKKIQN